MDPPAGRALHRRLLTFGREPHTMQMLVFVLASYGVTNILTAGRLFAGFRSRLAALSPLLGDWAKCPMCLGVPVGVAWTLLGLGPATSMAMPLDLAAAGAISSGGCWLLRVVTHSMGGDDL